MLNKEAFRYWQLGSLQDSLNYSRCVYVQSMAAVSQRFSLGVSFIESFRCFTDSWWPSDPSSDILDKAIVHYVSFSAIPLITLPEEPLHQSIDYTSPSELNVLYRCGHFLTGAVWKLVVYPHFLFLIPQPAPENPTAKHLKKMHVAQQGNSYKSLSALM